jgi:FMN phosphatase YigB (HAD superfamily)
MNDNVWIILDFDNTLFKITNAFYDKKIIEWNNRIKFILNKSFSLKPILSDLATIYHLDRRLANELYDEFDQLELESNVMILPDTIELFLLLDSLNAKTSILSDNSNKIIAHSLIKSGIHKNDMLVQGRERGYPGKPDTNNLEILYKKLKFTPNFIYYIGDSYRDAKVIEKFCDLYDFDYNYFSNVRDFITHIQS